MAISDGSDPRILLHAPTAGALLQARSNTAHRTQGAPRAAVRIAVHANAVAATLDTPDAAAHAPRIGREARTPLTVLPEGAVLSMARMQGEGWRHVRA